jgi:hypothetical protein
MRWTVLALLAANLCSAQRLLLVSLDGLGHQNLISGGPARELSIVRRSGFLTGLQTAFPSKTATSHAAIFTGVWGDRNGIFSNATPLTPRAEHQVTETRVGFRSDSLQVEPLWVQTARRGWPTVAYQVTQAYPFTERSAGLSLPQPPVVANAYQTQTFAPWRVIRQSDVRETQPGVYEWIDGPVRLSLRRMPGGLEITSGPARVTVLLAPLEAEPPGRRPLARHFSAPLPLTVNGLPTGAFFRLFELSPVDFLLVRSSVHEFGLSGGPPEAVGQLLLEAGPFVSNSPTSLYRRGQFGAMLQPDSIAERRYLECAELMIRQLTRQMLWLDQRFQPRVFLGYYPWPDDMEHLWLSVSAYQPEKGIDRYRRWGYLAANQGLTELAGRFRARGDHRVWVSDHGMAPIHTNVSLGIALRDAGFLAADDRNRIVAAKTLAVPNSGCLYVNTVDWKDGVVPLPQRAQMIDRIQETLRKLVDPRTRQAVVREFYPREKWAEPFGWTGPNGPDLCVDLQPGYYPTESLRDGLFRREELPQGEHGFVPLRLEMRPIFAVSGHRANWIRRSHPQRTIDILPLLRSLLENR